MKKTWMIAALFPALLLVCSCKQPTPQTDKKVERAFYHWKSVFNITVYEKAVLDSLSISTLYLKYFDVEWNNANQQPSPVAQIAIVDKEYLQTVNIIPVIFITNECLIKMDSSQALVLAERMHKLINEISASNNFTRISEIQIDCDWTAATKDKYFSLLRKFKSLINSCTLSATIRLHQVKFLSRSGLPPVDRGLLMCYNMGNLKNPSTTNSIIEPGELEKYIGNLHNYSLPLDIALPLFDWHVLFRNNNFQGLVQGLPDSIFNSSFVVPKGNRYSFLKDTTLAGYSFRRADVLRFERSDYTSVLKSAGLVSDRLGSDSLRVSVFHLDSITLKKYGIHELENIFSRIR